MTKVQFARAINAMLASVVSLPDELWKTGFPTVSIRLANMEAFIGLRPVASNGTSFLTAEGEDDEE